MYLPDEILELIFSYVNLKELFSLLEIENDGIQSAIADRLLKFDINDIIITYPSGNCYDLSLNYIKGIFLRLLSETNIKTILGTGKYFTRDGTIIEYEKVINNNIDLIASYSYGEYLIVKNKEAILYNYNDNPIKTLILPVQPKRIDLGNGIQMGFVDMENNLWIYWENKFSKTTITNVYTLKFMPVAKNKLILHVVLLNGDMFTVNDNDIKQIKNILPINDILTRQFILTEKGTLYFYDNDNLIERTLILKTPDKDIIKEPVCISNFYPTYYICTDACLYSSEKSGELKFIVDLTDYE